MALTIPNTRGRRAARCAKRALDTGLATFALLLVTPLLAVAIAMLAAQGTRILPRDPRLGRGGRIFRLLRLAPLGDGTVARTLDRMGVRQLPLLVNVIKGDLALVGPRPRPAGEAAAAELNPLALDREVRPGITGRAQVEQLRGPLTPAQVDALDEAYVTEWTLRSDLTLLGLTVWRSVRG